jgi:Zinc knuckle
VVGAGGNQAPPATPVGNAPPTPTVAATRTPPLMGGIDADGIAWSGGKPKVDWSGLESATAKKRSPNCIRSDKASEQVKAYNHRIAKPDEVFTKNTPTFDHVAYVEQVHAHVKNTGMDAIFYVPGMRNSAEMVSVIKGYDKVTLEHVAKESVKFTPLYDSYGVDNDESAKAYLLKTLDKDLLVKLKARLEDDDNAATTFMRIMHLALDGSVERYNRLKAEFKALSPLQEPGENVMVYAGKARAILKYLEQAKHFEWMLMLHLVNVLCTVSVQIFCMPWYLKRDTIDTDLNIYMHMDPVDGDEFMIKAGHHFTKILDRAEQQYKLLHDNGTWYPSTAVKDSGKAPGLFFAGKTYNQTQFNVLMQSAFSKKGPGSGTPATGGAAATTAANKAANVTCFNCKELGHYKNQCTKPTVTSPAVGSASSKSPHWCTVVPKSGEPTTQKRGNPAKTYNFCTKCKKGKGFWTDTHTTVTHTGGKGVRTTTVGANLAMFGDGLGIYQM